MIDVEKNAEKGTDSNLVDVSKNNRQQKHKTIEQAEQEGKYIRKVRSFVKREGRLTKGQERALNDHCKQWA